MRFIFTAGAILVWLACSTDTQAQPQQDRTDLQKSTSRATRNQQFELRYNLQQGETIRWSVEQIASTDTRMAGHEEKSSLRSRSVHSWTVESVDSLGNMTFRNQLDSASEWQKVGDDEPVSYDSESGEETPDIYLATAEKIGKPIATTTIDPQGGIVNRVDHITVAELGMGSITIPLPGKPVSIGEQWEVPEDIHARRKDKSIKTIKTRIQYTLRSVENGIAAISFRREVLTPIEDPWIEMQLQQKINQGTIQFDVARGRVVKKLVQWDEQVQGFEGNDSFLRYLGTYTMILQTPDTKQQAGSNPLQPLSPSATDRSSSYVKPRDGKPIIRK
jgi:hypothetical protein